MSLALSRSLKRTRIRLLALALVVSLAVMVGLAHVGASSHHMGAAAAMCLAVAASVALAVRSAPRLGRLLPEAPRWIGAVPVLSGPSVRPPDGRSRGQPALLQVFRL